MSNVRHWCGKIITAFVLFLVVIGTDSASVRGADDFSNAVDISVNVDVNGNVNKGFASEQNYYRFTLQEDGYVVLNISNPQQKDSKAYWSVYLYNSEYKQLCGAISVYGNKTSATSAEIGLGAGTYYVKINSAISYQAASTDVYTLNVNFTASTDWEKELNDNFTNATEILINHAYCGSITRGFSTESDYYKFVTDKDGYVTLNFSNPLQGHSNQAWYMYLYNENFEELCNQPVFGNVSATKSPTIGIKSGIYYVKVLSPVSYEAVSTDTYTISAGYTASDVWEKEFNNDFTTANMIQLNTEYHGVVSAGYSYEKDYFIVSINKAGTYAVEIKTPNLKDSGNYWCMHLYGGSYEELANVNIYGNQTLHKITKTLSAGTYYIRVNSSLGYTAASTEQYSVKVSEVKTDKSIGNLKVTAKKNKKTLTIKTISNAKVKISCDKKIFKNGKKTCTVYTNSKGNVSVKLPSKLKAGTKIKVTVSRAGYKTRTVTITVK
ncbi:MAG: hypothetical protein NC180_02365 [Muribaculaceae bacterium]|nr:hypothetical protein [Roseburia sp.]MCM1431583.1 hypothetical protein [Muribaculaceae bacterium]MCM1492048.1 hypothetical protein [Muribaculaceae bacterium]